MSLMWIVLIHLEHDSINIAITRKLSLIILQNYLKQDWSRWLYASRELMGTLVHDVYVFCKAPVIMSCKWIKLILQFLCPVMIFCCWLYRGFAVARQCALILRCPQDEKCCWRSSYLVTVGEWVFMAPNFDRLFAVLVFAV